jgi:hypothetical protein
MRAARVSSCVRWPAIGLAFIFGLNGAVAYAQQVECPLTGNTKLPSKVTFDDGSTIAVVDRLGDKLRTVMTLPDGRRSSGSAFRGLFVLTRELPTMTTELSWNQDLAHFFPLKVGEHIVADATVTLPSNRAGKYSTEMSVVGEEVVRIGSCDYPVLRIEVSSRFDQTPIAVKGLYYFHAASMLTLRSVIPTPATPTTPSRDVERYAIRIE